MTVANVGARNASFALRYLEDEHIRILAQDLGGIDARKLGYFPRSGRVLLKHLPVAATVADLAIETAYGRQLQRGQPAGDRSEEHTSELPSLMRISYTVSRMKKKTQTE